MARSRFARRVRLAAVDRFPVEYLPAAFGAEVFLVPGFRPPRLSGAFSSSPRCWEQKSHSARLATLNEPSQRLTVP